MKGKGNDSTVQNGIGKDNKGEMGKKGCGK